MSKTRIPIPSALRNEILSEFHHRCAICGKERPQIHHIDENPGNNDPANLLPLCPNCHLVDQHNPTAPVDQLKLRLFRKYKDPVILGSQFHPLFRRLKYLFELDDDLDFDKTLAAGIELVGFVKALRMGEFYHIKIADLLTVPNVDLVPSLVGQPDDVWTDTFARRNARFLEKLLTNRDLAVDLLIELLRYQEWPVPRAAT